MALSWNDLTEAEKLDLVKQYDIDKCTSIDYSRFSATPPSVRMMIRRHRRSIANTPATYTPIQAAIDDTKRWKDTLKRLSNKHRFLQVMHACDIHVPYHDENALTLFYKLVEHVQPHIVVVGSDFSDFQLLSSFGVDPDTVEHDDELDLFESYWNPHIHALDNAGAGALVYILGNHEKRIIQFLMRQAPSLRKTIMKRYVEIIRCGGRVQWIGEVDRVTIGDTVVQHGNRYGTYPAKGLLDDLGYQQSTMFGHNHKPSYFEKRGGLYTVKAVGSGCLCETEPHYIRAGALRAKHQLGTAIGDIDTHAHATNFDNLEFVPDSDGQLLTRLGYTTIQ